MSLSLLEKLRLLAASKDEKPTSKKIFEDTDDATDKKPTVKKSVKKNQKRDDTKNFELIKLLLDEISIETTKPKEKKKRNLSEERKDQLRIQMKMANEVKIAKRKKALEESQEVPQKSTKRHVESPEPVEVPKKVTSVEVPKKVVPSVVPAVVVPKQVAPVVVPKQVVPVVVPKQNIIYVSKNSGNKNKFN